MADRFDFTPPNWVKDDGTVMVWDSASHTYVARGDQGELSSPGHGDSKPVPDTSHAGGGDNFQFDPAEMNEQVGNPLFEGWMAHTGAEDIDFDRYVYEAEGNVMNAANRVFQNLQEQGMGRDAAWATAMEYARNWEQINPSQHQMDAYPERYPAGQKLPAFPDPTGETAPANPGFRSPEEEDYYRTASVVCPQCQQPGEIAHGRCLNCGHVFDNSGEDKNKAMLNNTDTDPFFDVVPKEDFAHMPGTGVPAALGKVAAEPAPTLGTPPAAGENFNFDDMFQPGMIGGKQETHRFVLDPAHNMYIAPATMDHKQIVDQNGIQEFARGSVYGDGTAEVHLQRMPGQIDKPGLETQLQQHIGGPINLTYMPGQEGQSQQETGGTFVVHGVAATERDGGGFAWRKEAGVPSQELTDTVALVFVAEHAETTDYPIYSRCRGGFLTATGGTTSHAAVVARAAGQPCLVGVGADYSKIGQGASVRIDGRGSAQIGPPNAKVQEYMQRGDQEWSNAMERRREIKQRQPYIPDWQLPNRGGSVSDNRPEDKPYEIVDGKFAAVSATLDECPECTSPMVDREGQKLCHSCGHRQQIMYAATKESIDLNPLDAAKGVGNWVEKNPWEAAGLAGAALIPGVGLAADAGLLGGGLAAGEGAAELGIGGQAARGLGQIGQAIIPGLGGGGEAAATADGVAEQAGVGGIRGMMQKGLNVGQQAGMAGMGVQGLQQGIGTAEGLAGMTPPPPGPDESGMQAQLAKVRAASSEGMWDFDFDPRLARDYEDEEAVTTEDDDEDEHEPSECPTCGGPGMLLGNLGKRKHYRCRNCGSDFSHQHRESKTGDELEVGGQRDDGDDITDEQTQGARLDHGDETSGESLRDTTADGGSSNSYDPAQSEALEAFQHAQSDPEISIFLNSDQSGRGHDGFERLIEQLAHAFPGAFDDLLPDAHEAEHDDSVGNEGGEEHEPKHTGDDSASSSGSDESDAKLGGTMDMTSEMIDFLQKQGYSVEKTAVPHRAPNDGAAQHAPANHPWVTKDGTHLESGKRYLMKPNGYSVPDDITVDQVTDSEIRFTVHGAGMDFPDKMDRQEFDNQGGFSFELKDAAPEDTVQQVDQREKVPATNQGQDAGSADPAQKTDLADLPTPVSSEQGDGESVFDNIPDEHIESSPEGELIYRDPMTGEEMNYQQYAAHLAAEAPEGMKWLWEDKHPGQDTEISDRMKAMMVSTAGRNFTPQQQKEFIQEQGEARNLSKLDLSNTHYTEHDGSAVDPDECWF